MSIGNPTPTERRIALMPIDAIGAEIDQLRANNDALARNLATARELATCGCGDEFTAHDPGTCGACVAQNDSGLQIESRKLAEMVAKLRADLDAARARVKEMEEAYSALGRENKYVNDRGKRAEDECDAARALLREARETWIKVGYGASHEDVAECRDLCDRIDAALREDKP